MKEIKPDLLLERLAGDVSSMLREDDGKKFVAENLAGKISAIYLKIPILSLLYNRLLIQ